MYIYIFIVKFIYLYEKKTNYFNILHFLIFFYFIIHHRKFYFDLYGLYNYYLNIFINKYY